jgi:hypothetical protein
MWMLYNSENFAVVQIDVPAPTAPESGISASGGYEIVDKFARKEIFIRGAMAQHFKEGVEALIETSPSQEEMDEYIERYASLMQTPLVLH